MLINNKCKFILIYILLGIDMESGKEGGTWLGVSLTGKAGVVLNLSSLEKSSTNIPKQGRGFLVSNFIISKHSATSYLDQLHKENKEVQYNPFLLVLLNLQYVNELKKNL